ncbi:YCII-related domain-containing protein [Actinacidiphila yanglinensis]|uniref:YCII-related domain-containing protein n=1 Tax=Actinacidiphila yanglinensis TaxID=310779 RepID=A0A1H6EBB1_9ACTN|nr:YciI family protein [Actinacidiphila yanglinensis]SEG94214.1 YCII-related domain-containing protein [Actinacidiphila yanglinensis]
MYVIKLRYTAPPSSVPGLIDRHQAYLDAHYATGEFLVSGRGVSYWGGLIVGVRCDSGAVQDMARQDPLVAEGIAELEVVEFEPSRWADADPDELRHALPDYH